MEVSASMVASVQSNSLTHRRTWLAGILSRLNRRGYLKRDRDPKDGRRVISGLSKKGRDMMERLWASGREQLTVVLKGVPAEDLRSLERALQVLTDAVESASLPGRAGGTLRA